MLIKVNFRHLMKWDVSVGAERSRAVQKCAWGRLKFTWRSRRHPETTRERTSLKGTIIESAAAAATAHGPTGAERVRPVCVSGRAGTWAVPQVNNRDSVLRALSLFGTHHTLSLHHLSPLTRPSTLAHALGPCASTSSLSPPQRAFLSLSLLLLCASSHLHHFMQIGARPMPRRPQTTAATCFCFAHPFCACCLSAADAAFDYVFSLAVSSDMWNWNSAFFYILRQNIYFKCVELNLEMANQSLQYKLDK